MKKSSIFKLLSLFMLAGMVLAACGGGDATEEPAAPDAPDAPAATAKPADTAEPDPTADNPYDEIP
ncbi:MAG: hypothetical protein IIC79_06010, partial [Chloroflexi bacterium]|nr:hypothetical protein [Chloroflexota bacterium]